MIRAKKELADMIKKKVAESGSYEKLATETKIGKTTLFRVANQDWKRPGKAIRQVADKFKVSLVIEKNAKHCKPILNVIDEIWDGSDEQAKVLASTLKQIALLGELKELRSNLN